jgi:hypothetical protein
MSWWKFECQQLSELLRLPMQATNYL